MKLYHFAFFLANDCVATAIADTRDHARGCVLDTLEVMPALAYPSAPWEFRGRINFAECRQYEEVVTECPHARKQLQRLYGIV